MTVALTQVLLLVFIGRQIKRHHTTEVQELVFALCFLVYSLVMLHRAKERLRESTPADEPAPIQPGT